MEAVLEQVRLCPAGVASSVLAKRVGVPQHEVNSLLKKLIAQGKVVKHKLLYKIAEVHVPDNVIVAGAGPVGCMTALLLSKQDPTRQIVLLERRADHRATTGTPQDLRSINLALSERGRAALRAVGLEHEILENAVPMYGRAVHSSTTDEVAVQRYDDVYGKECIYSVSRQVLSDKILAAVEQEINVQVKFSSDIMRVQVTEDKRGVQVQLRDSSKYVARLLVGCDGANSVVRECASHLCPMNFSKTFISHGYLELHIAALEDGQFALSPHQALHIWPDGKGAENMLIALPNPDGTFTATLFAPLSELRHVQDDDEEFENFFRGLFPLAVRHFDLTRRGRAFPLFTANSSPWVVDDLIVLLGDAAHTQVPFFGQGMNAGLEDAVEFFETLVGCQGDFARALPLFDQKRRPSGHAITALSLENYVEMSSHSASWLFRLGKRLEGMSARWTGVMPLYYATAFTREPYSSILARKQRLNHWGRALWWTSIVLGNCVAGASLLWWMRRR